MELDKGVPGDGAVDAVSLLGAAAEGHGANLRASGVKRLSEEESGR